MSSAAQPSRVPIRPCPRGSRRRLLAGACPLIGMGLLLTSLTGCPPPATRQVATRREALEHINDNLALIHEPLQCSGLVSFRFRDDNGRERAFVGHEARLIYQPPQSLLFDVLTLGGTAARFGSDADHYWVWIDVPDLRKLWWGAWQHTQPAAAGKLPVPPDELFDALLLRPLPESLEGGQLPVLRVEQDDCRLIFMRLGPGGQPVGWREVRLGPRPPFLPVEIVDRSPDGDVAMRAELSNYQPIGPGGPFTPRRYVVQWPDRNGGLRAELRLDILGAKFRPPLPDEQFRLPAGWQGEVEAIHAPDQGRLQP